MCVCGGVLGNGTFDHPLETPWSFSELDKPAHPLFRPGQQRRWGRGVRRDAAAVSIDLFKNECWSDLILGGLCSLRLQPLPGLLR